MAGLLPVVALFLTPIGIFALSSLFGDHAVLARILLSCAAGLFAFTLVEATVSPTGGPLTITACTYFIWFFILPGACHAAKNRFPFYNFAYSDDSVLQASIVVLVTSIGFTVARFFVGPRPAVVPRLAHHPRPARLILFLFAAIAVSAILISIAGIDTFVRRRADPTTFVAADSSIRQLLVSLPSLLTLIGVLVAIRARRAISSASARLAFVLLIPLFAISNFPLALSRFMLFGVLITGVEALVGIHSSRMKAIYALAFPIGTYTVFPIMDQIARGDTYAGLQLDIAQYISAHGDFDGFQSLINTVDYVQIHGLSFGYQLLGTIFLFVPRSIWPGKPYPTGPVTAEVGRYDYLNISAPMPAECYIDFGILGVFVLSIALGCCARAWDKRAARYHGRDIVRDLLYAGVIGFTIIMLRGSWAAIAGPLYAYVLIILFLSRFAFVKRDVTGRNRAEITGKSRTYALGGALRRRRDQTSELPYRHPGRVTGR